MLANTTLGVGYMAYIVETNSIYLYQGPDPANIDSYILLASGGGSGGGSVSVLTGQYKFDSDTTEADPGAGFVRLNSACLSLPHLKSTLDALTQQAVNIGFILDRWPLGMKSDCSFRLMMITMQCLNFWNHPLTWMAGGSFLWSTRSVNGAIFVDDDDILATVMLGGTPYDQMNLDGGRADSIYNTIPGIDGGTP